jgi:hypothetical protein
VPEWRLKLCHASQHVSHFEIARIQGKKAVPLRMAIPAALPAGRFALAVQAKKRESCAHSPMKILRLALAALLTVSSLHAAEEFTPEPGFISLCNGKDLSGWGYKDESGKVVALDGKTEASDGRYIAKDGGIVVNPHDAARGPKLRQLWTVHEFQQDFVLKLEFRAAVDADSGIFLRKPQLQCRDYLVAGPYKTLKSYKPQDWNVIVVTVKDGVAHCTCNGEVLEAALKLPETGPIGLEADRGQMEYRRIQIKALP